MIFPSEKKKELWRYASRNNPVTCDADGIPIPMQQPQPPLLQHPHHPQTFASCCCCTDPSLTRPYYSIPCSIDSGSQRLIQCQPQSTPQDQQKLTYHQQRTDSEADWMTEDSVYSCIKDGRNFESSGADILSDENDQYPVVYPACSNAHTQTPATASFAMTAASMFRNCCGRGGGGGGGQSTDTRSGFFIRTTPPPPDNNRRHALSRQRTLIAHPTISMNPQLAAGAVDNSNSSSAIRHRTPNQIFNALVKKLKNKQVAELLQAVKSRVDPPAKSNVVMSTSPSYLQCILIKCTAPLDEIQHVITCQLFFWSDLRDAGELRRLPTCPSALDYIYTCCNPLHWFRIIYPIDSEHAPPPYQRSKMPRLRDTGSDGNTQNTERSSSGMWTVKGNSGSHSRSSSSVIKQSESQLYMPCVESFTTNGKDRSACLNAWCQIAYWELAQRVGELYHAKKSAVNIYADGPIECAGESICLRDLEGAGRRLQSDAVQNTRQKVGLGVTLSLENGDVWIYNRSNVPIFVDSPTLSERLDRVCKVLPGYCLKAFESNRAQMLACKQSQQTRLGPIDIFSMKVSFAKGWGNTYRRQDIMGCPCWLEVHFSQLR